MAERKDTNPFTSEDTTNPHLPPNVYQPNPFPINPTEGNPWAASQSYQQPPQNQKSDYGHSYNNTSSDGSYSNYPAYMPMPSPNDSTFDYNTNTYKPSAYDTTDSNSFNANTYNTNAYSNAYDYSDDTSPTEYNENVKGDKDNTELDDSVPTANPGVETHDPDKLKISSQMVKTPSHRPNKWRVLFRFIQFIAGCGAFAFMIAATPVANKNKPKDVTIPPKVAKGVEIAIIFVYIVSAISIIYSFGHLILYCLRRWGDKNKAPRWSLMLIDFVLGASFGTIVVFLIKDFTCKPGSLNGWCEFYNTAIFFTVLSFVTCAVMFVWDIVGGFKRKNI